MRRLLLMWLALLASAGGASVPDAFAQGANNPYYTRETQGSVFATRYLTVGTTSTCVVDDDSPCWGGWLHTAGTLASLTIENTGAYAVWCTTGATAAASQGILLVANGGSASFERAVRNLNLNCIAVGGSSVVALAFESLAALPPTPTPSPTPTPTPTP